MNKNITNEPFTLTSGDKENTATRIRDFHGYHQYLDSYHAGDRVVKRWTFYICGFCYDDLHANVLRSDGSKEAVPIDAKGRILIMGKRYGRTHWNH